MLSNKNRVLAVIPCFNEVKTVRDVIAKTKKYCKNVIVVDNNSADGSWDEIEKEVPCYNMHKMYIKGAGITTEYGLVNALNPFYHANIVVTLDADGQHNPSEIPKFIKPVIEGEADLVIGTRSMKFGELPFLRWLGNKIFNYLCNIGLKNKVADTGCGFRAFNIKALEGIMPIKSKRFGFCEEVIIKARAKGYKIVQVPIQTIYGNEIHKYSFIAAMQRGLEIPYLILKWRWICEWSKAS